MYLTRLFIKSFHPKIWISIFWISFLNWIGHSFTTRNDCYKLILVSSLLKLVFHKWKLVIKYNLKWLMNSQFVSRIHEVTWRMTYLEQLISENIKILALQDFDHGKELVNKRFYYFIGKIEIDMVEVSWLGLIKIFRISVYKYFLYYKMLSYQLQFSLFQPLL